MGNFRTRNVDALSPLYHAYNLLGFLCYSVFTVGSRVLQQIYGLPEAVTVHDCFFAVHNLICCFLLISQILMYRRSRTEILAGETKISPANLGLQEFLLSLVLFLIICSFLLALTGRIPWWHRHPDHDSDPHGAPEQICFLSALGYMKVIITFFKYPAQIALNAQRGSCEGLSQSFYLLDVIGALCSLGQNIVAAQLFNAPGLLWGNLPKMCLGVLVLFYDFLILAQFWWFSLSPQNRPVILLAPGALVARIFRICRKKATGISNLSTSSSSAHAAHSELQQPTADTLGRTGSLTSSGLPGRPSAVEMVRKDDDDPLASTFDTKYR